MQGLPNVIKGHYSCHKMTFIQTNTTVASVYSSGVGQVRMLKYFRYYVRALFSLP